MCRNGIINPDSAEETHLTAGRSTGGTVISDRGLSRVVVATASTAGRTFSLGTFDPNVNPATSDNVLFVALRSAIMWSRTCNNAV